MSSFLLPGWRVFLNNGSLGIAPRPVVAAVTDYLNDAAALKSDEYPRWGYETLDEERTEMAEYAGCKKDELAFVHKRHRGDEHLCRGSRPEGRR